MGVPTMDHLGREELLRIIARNAASYTPEWRFDPEQPDLGTALALIYAELFAQTLKRYHQVPEKNMAAFFNSVGARLLPSLPAAGFVRFGLAGDTVDGQEVPAGTPLLADDSDEDGGSVVFETADDVFVTPAEPEQIFTVCGAEDVIVRAFDRRSNPTQPFACFDLRGENLQQHRMYLRQDAVLELSAGAGLEVELTPSHQREMPQALMAALSDPNRAVWEYSYRGLWQCFSSCTAQGNRMRLELGPHSLPVTVSELPELEEHRWLRLRLTEGTALPPFSLRQIRLSSRNHKLPADAVHAAGSDQDIHQFFPFGEQLGLFAEGYFGCGEALSKRGAEIELSFNLNFIPIPVEELPGETPVNWKLVMKRSDFRVDEEVDISIQEVLWEYFNGNGWARLFPDNRDSGCFTAGKGALGRYCTLRFRCPEDIQPVLVNANTGYFIRARVLKINNLYKRKGNYIAPLIEGLQFAYHYPGKGRLAEAAVIENNREVHTLDGAALRDPYAVLTPFVYLQEEKAALYFGFPRPPEGGVVKLLFLLEQALREKPGRLAWEYAVQTGWESLNVVDETENLRQSGILTMLSGAPFARRSLWGESLFWVRAVDQEGLYFGRTPPVQLPRITGLYMNATRVTNVDTCPPERFFIQPEEQGFTCRLLSPRVYRAEVWVNELEKLLPAQIAELKAQGALREVRDAAGILREAWVRWEERDDFALSGPADRHYLLERNEGVLRFSDGVHGRIPPAGPQETIWVQYAVGGGRAGNVPAGQINRSSQSLGFVGLIENPRATAGGCDQETVPQAVRRGGAALRHGDRAVTAGDFEALALESTRNIVRAKCFPHRDDLGAFRPGWITLVVLLGDQDAGCDLFPVVRAQAASYITARCGGNLAALEHFQIVQPQFLELRVKVELTVGDFNQVFAVRQEVRRRLDAFLHPLTGNFDGRGWPVGRIPKATQLRNCLSGFKAIRFLKNVTLSAFRESGFDLTEVNPEDLRDFPFALPRSGPHEIQISVE